MSILGDNIKNKRLQLNLTQEELATKLGYKSRSSINKIELGINDISQRKIKAFADALQTTPACLLGLEQETIDNYVLVSLNGNKQKYRVSAEQINIILSMLKQFTISKG